jgi:glutathione synthase/RimK-type ligase-like ATP-grasp enzyme
VVGAYHRVGAKGSFLTNVSLGASIEPIHDLNPTLRRFAECILDAVNGDVAGIDIARDTEGRYWFEEVNIAFETGSQSIRLLGDGIWRQTLALMEGMVVKNPPRGGFRKQ